MLQDRPESAFHRAARIGDLAALESLLAAGADVSARWSIEGDYGPFLRGQTPLMLAAASDEGASVATLRWLLNHGADLRAVSAAGVTAAWYAASGNPCWMREPRFDASNAERLQFLLDQGLEPSETAKNGRSLLSEAARSGDVRRVSLLLERGVSPEYQGRDEPLSFMIPLFGAAESGSAECVDALLRKGANPNVRDRGGATPLMVAATPEVAQRLVAGGADARAIDNSGQDVLGNFLRDSQDNPPRLRRFEVAQALLAAGASLLRIGPYDSSRLHSQAFHLDDSAVEFFLSLGVVPAPDSRGQETPLHAVCWQSSGYDSQVDARIGRIVRALVAAGNSVDARAEQDWTPLHAACGGDGGNAAAIATLLALGADPEATEARGATPLHVASRNGEVSCIRLLLAAGANPLRREPDCATPIDGARGHQSVWRRLFAEAAPDKIERYRKCLADADEALRILEEAAASRGT